MKAYKLNKLFFYKNNKIKVLLVIKFLKLIIIKIIINLSFILVNYIIIILKEKKFK
jgi:hypothetical protein